MKKLFSFLLCGTILLSFTSCEDATRDRDKGGNDESSSNGGGNYESVDLGLPSGTLWAAYNVGATAPEEYGNYFAWGETTSKETYSWDTYKYGTYDYWNSINTLTKYNPEVDEKTILEASDDAATANWGDTWRMPTHEEQTELRTECIWTWTDNYDSTGVAGYIVSSKKEGNTNSIFLPAAGGRGDSILYGEGEACQYWSSSLSKDGPGYACGIVARSGRVGWNDIDRYVGSSVRAVRAGGSSSGDTNETYTVTLDVNDSDMGYVSGAGSYKQGEKITISATAYDGYQFVEWSDGNTDNPRQITLTQDITLTAIFEAQSQGGFNGHEYVDLGLPSGTLWATCNVGANSPEEYGDYFAWGETTTKEKYSWSAEGDYKWGVYNSSASPNYGMTKYNTTDGKTVLDPEDDAATVNWGGKWRMPTFEELYELRTECTWSWTTLNGVYGCRVTSKKDTSKSIFLPAAGYRADSSLNRTGSYGSFWSSSLYSGDSSSAWYLYFGSGGRSADYGVRFIGHSVRPVSSY